MENPFVTLSSPRWWYLGSEDSHPQHLVCDVFAMMNALTVDASRRILVTESGPSLESKTLSDLNEFPQLFSFFHT